VTPATADLALVAACVVAGFVAGGVAHSLVLDSYAAYLLADAVSIALALVVGRLAARPARGHYTFGLKRAEILVAQVNGVCLIVLAGSLGCLFISARLFVACGRSDHATASPSTRTGRGAVTTAVRRGR
jgi:Co/Zn/Cd efflux system component